MLRSLRARPAKPKPVEAYKLAGLPEFQIELIESFGSAMQIYCEEGCPVVKTELYSTRILRDRERRVAAWTNACHEYSDLWNGVRAMRTGFVWTTWTLLRDQVSKLSDAWKAIQIVAPPDPQVLSVIWDDCVRLYELCSMCADPYTAGAPLDYSDTEIWDAVRRGNGTDPKTNYSVSMAPFASDALHGVVLGSDASSHSASTAASGTHALDRSETTMPSMTKASTWAWLRNSISEGVSRRSTH